MDDVCQSSYIQGYAQEAGAGDGELLPIAILAEELVHVYLSKARMANRYAQSKTNVLGMFLHCTKDENAVVRTFRVGSMVMFNDTFIEVVYSMDIE